MQPVAAVPKLVTTMRKEVRQPGTVAGTTLYGAQNVTGVSTFRPPCAIATGRRDAAGGDLPAHLQRQIGLTQGFEGGGKAHQVRSLALGQHDDVVARLCGERCG